MVTAVHNGTTKAPIDSRHYVFVCQICTNSYTGNTKKAPHGQQTSTPSLIAHDQQARSLSIFYLGKISLAAPILQRARLGAYAIVQT